MMRALVLLLFFAGITSPLHAIELIAKRAALSTVDARATAVGVDVLRRGGTAADAAVAVNFALAVVNPEAGNIAGGGFLVYYEKSTGAVWTLDFRSVAPRAASAKMFLNADGSVKTDSRVGALSVAVPGAVAGMGAVHERFGKLSWAELIQPAILLANEGYVTDARLVRALLTESQDRKIEQFKRFASVFFPNGKPIEPGTRLVQKELARTLTRIAQRGPREFYTGQTGKNFVTSLRREGGVISLRDLREYKPLWRAPVAITFGEYRLYTMPPPSAAGIILGESLAMLRHFDLVSAGFQTPESVHLIAEATRRAYVDRNRYLGDPAFTKIPFADLLAEKRIATLAASIDRARATSTAAYVASATREREQTLHYSIVDTEGNIAVVTTTLNGWFGSGVIVDGGFITNNDMDDFATRPGVPNAFGLIQSAANEIRPGARPASSMSPTIIFKDGAPWLVFGSPGGSTIPTTLLQVFLHVAVHGKTLAEAVAAPRYHQQDFPEELQVEAARADRSLLPKLNEMGHGIKERSDIGDVHAIMFLDGRLIAVADARRGGAPGGF